MINVLLCLFFSWPVIVSSLPPIQPVSDVVIEELEPEVVRMIDDFPIELLYEYIKHDTTIEGTERETLLKKIEVGYPELKNKQPLYRSDLIRFLEWIFAPICALKPHR